MENEFEKGFIAGYLINYHKDDDKPKPDQKTWTYPSNWLKLPEPADNQIIVLFDADKHGSNSSLQYYRGTCGIEIPSGGTDDIKVNWGDGTGDWTFWNADKYGNSANYAHEFIPGTGHDTGESEQWIVTWTFNEEREVGEEYLFSLCYTTYSSKAAMRMPAIKIGNTKYLNSDSNSSIGTSKSLLRYIKILNDELNITYKFHGASHLSKVELSESITKIPYKCFSNAYNLFDINLTNITEIGDSAFSSCCKLNPSGKMPNLTTIGNYAFQNTGITSCNFPKLTSIGQYAFSSCSLMTNITIPKGVTYINNYAFQSCQSLRSVDLSNVTEIGTYAFTMCSSLKTIKSDKVLTINNAAFRSCNRLLTAEFPSCNSVGNMAFQNCYCLELCILASGADIDSTAFSNTYICEVKFEESKESEEESST